MNWAIILSGGIGQRFGENIPKQYIEVDGRPILSYCLERFQQSNVDKIIIVCAEQWQSFVLEIVKKYSITKFAGFALPGKSRQHSVLSGLRKIKEFNPNDCDNVLIHDGVRPLTPVSLINDCIDSFKDSEAVMPVINVNETIYQTEDNESICSIPFRDYLRSGQTPEGYKYSKFLEINESVSDEELSKTRSNSEMAFKHRINVKLIDGADINFKITTKLDVSILKHYLENK